jgi:hypothetical protein
VRITISNVCNYEGVKRLNKQLNLHVACVLFALCSSWRERDTREQSQTFFPFYFLNSHLAAAKIGRRTASWAVLPLRGAFGSASCLWMQICWLSPLLYVLLEASLTTLPSHYLQKMRLEWFHMVWYQIIRLITSQLKQKHTPWTAWTLCDKNQITLNMFFNVTSIQAFFMIHAQPVNFKPAVRT